MIASTSIDFLIRLKNASLAGRQTMTAPASKLIIAIASMLKKYNYISGYSVSEGTARTVTITLSYLKNNPVISDVRLFSKPGRRLYSHATSLPWGQTPDSLIIVSTSSGVMSQKEAVAKGIGGEVIAEIF